MPLNVKSHDVYDAITHMLDLIGLEPDPVARLALVTFAHRIVNERLITERNALAYEARQKFASEDIADAIGIDRKMLLNWTNRHRAAKGLPPVGQRKRTDLVNAKDIRGIIDVGEYAPYVASLRNTRNAAK